MWTPPNQRMNKKITGANEARQGGNRERWLKCLSKYPSTRKEEWESNKASKQCHQFGHSPWGCKVSPAKKLTPSILVTKGQFSGCFRKTQHTRGSRPQYDEGVRLTHWDKQVGRAGDGEGSNQMTSWEGGAGRRTLRGRSRQKNSRSVAMKRYRATYQQKHRSGEDYSSEDKAEQRSKFPAASPPL